MQIACNNSRSVAQKQALYRCMVEKLGRAPGVRKEDVFIHLVETSKENWSFGNGVGHYI